MAVGAVGLVAAEDGEPCRFCRPRPAVPLAGGAMRLVARQHLGAVRRQAAAGLAFERDMLVIARTSDRGVTFGLARRVRPVLATPDVRADRALQVLHPVPELLLDDAQMRHLVGDRVGGRVRSRCRILQCAATSGSAGRWRARRAGSRCPARSRISSRSSSIPISRRSSAAGDASGVPVDRDDPRAGSRGVALELSAGSSRFPWIHGPFPVGKMQRGDRWAIKPVAAAAPTRRPAPDPPPPLLGELTKQ